MTGTGAWAVGIPDEVEFANQGQPGPALIAALPAPLLAAAVRRRRGARSPLARLVDLAFMTGSRWNIEECL
jgi:hypothetical protein